MKLLIFGLRSSQIYKLLSNNIQSLRKPWNSWNLWLSRIWLLQLLTNTKCSLSFAFAFDEWNCKNCTCTDRAITLNQYYSISILAKFFMFFLTDTVITLFFSDKITKWFFNIIFCFYLPVSQPWNSLQTIDVWYHHTYFYSNLMQYMSTSLNLQDYLFATYC
jgi:hypothetical protein